MTVFENDLGVRVRVVVDDIGGAGSGEKLGTLTVQEVGHSSASGVIFIDPNTEVDIICDFSSFPRADLEAFAKSVDWLSPDAVSAESSLSEAPGYRVRARMARNQSTVQRSDGKSVEYALKGEVSVSLTSARLSRPDISIEEVEAGSTWPLERRNGIDYLTVPNYSYGRASVTWVMDGHVVAITAEMDLERLLELAGQVAGIDQAAWDALMMSSH